MEPRIYFWRYASGQKNYPGYHLCADGKGCNFLIGRIRSRRSMRMFRPLIFDLTKPSLRVLAVPNNGHHKARSKQRLALSICFDRDDEWLDIEEDSTSIEVSFSSTKISEFLDNGRHSSTDVRYRADFVRFTLKSRHSGQGWECLKLTQAV